MSHTKKEVLEEGHWFTEQSEAYSEQDHHSHSSTPNQAANHQLDHKAVKPVMLSMIILVITVITIVVLWLSTMLINISSPIKGQQRSDAYEAFWKPGTMDNGNYK